MTPCGTFAFDVNIQTALTLHPGANQIVTDLKVRPSNGYVLLLQARSHLQGILAFAVEPGIIDTDYNEVLKITVMNYSDNSIYLPGPACFAQLILVSSPRGELCRWEPYPSSKHVGHGSTLSDSSYKDFVTVMRKNINTVLLN